MKKEQQIVLAIILPLIILLATYGISISNFLIRTINTITLFDNRLLGHLTFQETWFVWLLSLIIIGVVEYFIFSKEIKK